MISQNKKKLVKLLEWDYLSIEWFNNFMLYVSNIIKYWDIYLEYKRLDAEYKYFNKLKNNEKGEC